MTVGEANDLNQVLNYLLGLPGVSGAIPTADVVQEAAERLADRAHKTLMCGLNGEQIRGMKQQLRAWG